MFKFSTKLIPFYSCKNIVNPNKHHFAKRTIKVVCVEDIPNFGNKGLVRTCKPGALRNWLRPQKLAAIATKENIDTYYDPKAEKINSLKKEKKAEQKRVKRMSKTVLKIYRPHSNRILDQKITEGDISALMFKHFSVILDPEKIEIKDHEIIEKLGNYDFYADHEGNRVKMHILIEPIKIIEKEKFEID
ncbi:hypothetical protein MHBO_000853 [Bonamia ostreae]|uniref:Ribosomal protein L9 domain-containing protein n=1 Tax=Bonamia ostreae TaxID=126728 RepID=A0ABV2AHL9_9EUKA